MLKKRSEMNASPCFFGGEYTVKKNVTAEVKQEMRRKVKNGIGYVV